MSLNRFLIRYVELLAGLAGALLVVAGVFVLGLPPLIAGGLGIAVFAGAWLMGSSWLDMRIAEQARRLDGPSVTERLAAGETQVHELKRIAQAMPRKKTKDKILALCGIAERTFQVFRQDPDQRHHAGRFLLYLDRFLPLALQYAKLASTPEGRQLMQQGGQDKEFEELLDTAQTAFSQGLMNLLAHHAVEVKTVSRVLKKMMRMAGPAAKD